MPDSGNGGSVFDTIANVIGLTPAKPLNKFGKIWYQVFLWALFSSLFVHLVAAAIAFCRLHSHKFGRWTPLLIVAMGVVSPLTGGALTSAVVAGVYRSAGIVMQPLFALFWGVGQTIFVLLVSFSRILATL
ncbi:PREDICTED: transmembrane protein 170A-like [Priapulus caudatus]|uniref:Transmembrane protein 170A-like n=1 Tax=Priapulus caudatus TaxID=37621 RepID=A0ABM1DZ62_PRICU|nr:PREDICTED: transmembrane protein 170A-like [Priapulus caudatus]